MDRILFQLPDDRGEVAMLAPGIPSNGASVEIAGDMRTYKVAFTSWEERSKGIMTAIVCLRHFSYTDLPA